MAVVPASALRLRRTGLIWIGLNLLAAFRATTCRYSTHSGSSYGGIRGAIAASVMPFCRRYATTVNNGRPSVWQISESDARSFHVVMTSRPLFGLVNLRHLGLYELLNSSWTFSSGSLQISAALPGSIPAMRRCLHFCMISPSLQRSLYRRVRSGNSCSGNSCSGRSLLACSSGSIFSGSFWVAVSAVHLSINVSSAI